MPGHVNMSIYICTLFIIYVYSNATYPSCPTFKGHSCLVGRLCPVILSATVFILLSIFITIPIHLSVPIQGDSYPKHVSTNLC